MIEFAVWHEGIPLTADGNKQGRWVLALDRSALLLADDTGEFYWKDIADCTLVRVVTPDVPRPVLPVQMQTQAQQKGLVIAEPNRAMRRSNGNG